MPARGGNGPGRAESVYAIDFTGKNLPKFGDKFEQFGTMRRMQHCV
jgi:hypothetical protein